MPVGLVAADFNADNKLDLATINQTDNTVSVLLGNNDGTFATQPAIAAAPRLMGLATGDFNRDGMPDLVAVTLDGNLIVLSNTGQGSFSAKTTNLGSNAGAVVVGDLNGDGNPDLVVSDPLSSALTVLLGDGNGGFQTDFFQANVDTFIVGAVVLGDFDHDGKLDLAISGSTSSSIAILLGNGDGTFQQPLAVGFGAASPTLAVGDFNNDNYLDLVGVDSNDNDAAILLGDGKGGFTARTDLALPASGGIAGSAVADFDGDGKLDVAAVQFNQDMTGTTGFITVMPGNGDGTFRQPVSTQVANIGIGQMIVGDFNGDGKPDVATSQPSTGTISVVLGNGDGTFGAAIANPVNLSGAIVQAMIGGDFNNDGKGDLALVGTLGSGNTSPLYVLTSNGDGTFQAHLVDNLPIDSFDLAAGDFNHDGNLDLVALDYNGAVNPSVFIYLGKGDGTFSGPVMYSTGSFFTNTVQAADFDGDGNVDVTVGTDQGLFFFGGSGDGTFKPFVKTAVPFSVVTSLLGDFNGDHKPDLAVMGNGNAAVNILLGNGDGTFQPILPVEAPYQPRGLPSIGDLNADGSSDLVQFSATNTLSVAPQTLSVWSSTPTISFSAPRLDFASQNVGTSSPAAKIALVNVGNAPLSISNIAAGGSFSESNDCTGPVAMGEGCSVSVTFTPTKAGAANGTLTFSDNAHPGAQTLILTGSGSLSDFSISAAPSANSVAAGGSATYTITLAPIGTFTGTVQLACSGAPAKTTCTLSKSSVTLDESSPAPVTVTVITTAQTVAALSSSPLPKTTFSGSFLWACAGFAPIAGLLLIKKRRLAAVAGVTVLAWTLVSCGGGSTTGTGGGGGTIPGTPPGTYTLSVSGTAGSLEHTSTITLTVN
jgi:hypothetical protein